MQETIDEHQNHKQETLRVTLDLPKFHRADRFCGAEFSSTKNSSPHDSLWFDMRNVRKRFPSLHFTILKLSF